MTGAYVKYGDDWDGITIHEHHEPSLWLRNEIAAVRQAAVNGTMISCGHGDYGFLTVELWQPDRAWCEACFPSAKLPDDWDEAHCCDRCHRSTERIRSLACDLGGLILVFGLCPDCRDREGLDEDRWSL